MLRSLSTLALLPVAACFAQDADPDLASTTQAVSAAIQRMRVSGDIYEYTFTIPVGRGPNAGLRVHRIVRERAPFVARATTRAALLLHGDFATFDTNFASGLAPFLAARDVDVWGVDRRWTLAAADLAGFGAMGLAQELGDVHAALAFARVTRLATGSPDRKLALVGFSHGAQLAYTYAAADGANVNALAALDFFAAYGPTDSDLQAASCANSELEYQFVADGMVDSPNDFFIDAGHLDLTAPDDPSPIIDGLTNRETVRFLLGETYQFAPITPDYRLLQPDASGAFANTPQATADHWIASAPPHQSMREAADLDAQLCGTGPVDAPLAHIRVPLLYLGAASGVGAHGLFTTTQVGSTDVTTRIVPNYGHGDLLYASTAAQLAWQPLATWLAHH